MLKEVQDYFDPNIPTVKAKPKAQRPAQPKEPDPVPSPNDPPKVPQPKASTAGHVPAPDYSSNSYVEDPENLTPEKVTPPAPSLTAAGLKLLGPLPDPESDSSLSYVEDEETSIPNWKRKRMMRRMRIKRMIQ